MIKRPTWILLFIFIVLVAITLYWSRTSKNEIGEEEPSVTPPVMLLNLDSENIKNVVIQDNLNSSIELERNESGEWILVSPEGMITPNAGVEDTLRQFFTISILSEFKSAPPSDATGLTSPDYEIKLTTSDNKTTWILIGNGTVTGSGYYVKVSDGNVVVVNKFVIDNMVSWIQNPPVATIEIFGETDNKNPPSATETSIP